MRKVLLALLALLLPCALPGPAAAQATGSINGVVSDPSESVLPGVTIEVTNIATNQTRRAVTGSDGFYTVPLLQPGSYTVKATLAGFRTTSREGVQVTVESSARVDLRLAVASVEETITITEEPPLVETANSQLGIVVD